MKKRYYVISDYYQIKGGYNELPRFGYDDGRRYDYRYLILDRANHNRPIEENGKISYFSNRKLAVKHINVLLNGKENVL